MSHMDILTKLFSSGPLVKIMRLFLANTEQGFENKDIASKSKISASAVRAEVNLLKSIDFIKKTSFSKDIPPKTKNGKPKKKRVSGWVLNQEFPYLLPLKQLLLSPGNLEREELVKRVKRAGNIKAIILSGIFINESDSNVDVLVVGDRLKKSALDQIFRNVEAQMGKELSYAFFETTELKYRLGVYDKFVRSILDHPHEKIV